jgi:hypothetical protein
MILIRLFIVIALLVLGVCVGLYLFTRDRKFLAFAARAFKFSLVVFLVLGGLYVLERLIML